MRDPDRERLAARCLASKARIVLVAALPGTGKTLLLQEIARQAGVALLNRMPATPAPGPLVVDLPADRSIALAHAPAADPLILAARPVQIEDLARFRLYGEVEEIGTADLFLSESGAAAFERSAGWPALDAHFARQPEDPGASLDYLRHVLTEALAEDERAALLALCRSEVGLRAESLPPETEQGLRSLAPLVGRHGDRWQFRTAGVAELFGRATRDLPAGPAVLALLDQAGPPLTAVCEAVTEGHRRRALTMFKRQGGMFLTHLQGLAAARRVQRAFGDDRDPELVGLAFMAEVKAGDTERAAHLLGRAGGAELPDLGRPLRDPDAVPAGLLLCRLLLSIYRHESASQFLLSEASGLLARLDGDDHLMRGSVYNTVLEMHIRAAAYAEAEETATRALRHYERANAPYLAFYIHVHRAVIQLATGNPDRAQAPLEAAGTALAATPFEAPQDVRFLRLLRAVVEYEQGDPARMADFADEVFESFAYGEMWPTIAEQALAHGADALLQLRGLEPAMRYLDSWRVQAWRTRRFRVLIEQREVAVLQGARRWREARVQLEQMAMRIGRVWMDSSGENLADLRAPEDISQATLWLRQQAFERPREPALRRRIEAFARNPRLSWRSQTCLKTWQAWIERRQGRVAPARRLLADVLGTCAAHRCTAPVLEERIFVLPMLEDRRVMQGPMTEAPIPRNLRRGAARAFGTGPLSRQEWRALLLLVEGCSNKEIAREMEVSLPTVKFHLKNLYAKLEVSGRRAAIEAARERQLVDI